MSAKGKSKEQDSKLPTTDEAKPEEVQSTQEVVTKELTESELAEQKRKLEEKRLEGFQNELQVLLRKYNVTMEPSMTINIRVVK